MCGRFVLTHTLAEICAAFSASSALAGITAHYNIAPETRQAIVVKDRVGEGVWGWPVAPTYSPVINIRSEGMADKPMFARSVAMGRRCLVPASGFYEWDNDGQPFYVHAPDAPLIALAGLWTRDENDAVRFGIVTRAALPHLGPVHPRMPLTLTPATAQDWLQQGALPEPPGLEIYPVGKAVNTVANDNAGLLDRLAGAPQGNLFMGQA